MFIKYITATVSSIFIFAAVFLLLGLGLSFVMPSKWFDIVINPGLLKANIPSILSAILAAVAATYTFKASLHSKTGRLYRKKSGE
jgi:hypothetical protein